MIVVEGISSLFDVFAESKGDRRENACSRSEVGELEGGEVVIDPVNAG